MRKPSLFALSLFATSLAMPATANAGPWPRRLPPAEDFHLTLQQLPQSAAPAGPSCGGEASLTLPCQVFKLMLQNGSTHTIRISELGCAEPEIEFVKKDPRSTSGDWPVSQPANRPCSARDWINLRLRPGETIEHVTRLITPRRNFGDPTEFSTRSYSIHAEWTLIGCTEQSEGTDCFAPLQIIHASDAAAPVDFQEPVKVLSNEVDVELNALPDLGKMKFDFQVAPTTGRVTDLPASDYVCRPSDTTADCVAFRYSLRNLGDHPVRNYTFTCSDSDIIPEYRYEGGDWRRVPQRSWLCSANISRATPILPGDVIEGTFNLNTLRPAYDTKALKAPGSYEFRFTFGADACISSPDGRFCLQYPANQPRVLSNVIQVQAPKP